MCVTELTDQVMCQTTTVRTKTPQTSRLRPSCTPPTQVAGPAPSRRSEARGKEQRPTGALIHTQQPAFRSSPCRTGRAADPWRSARTSTAVSGRGSRPATSPCGPRGNSPAGCAGRAARRSAGGACGGSPPSAPACPAEQQTPRTAKACSSHCWAGEAAMRQQAVVAELMPSVPKTYKPATASATPVQLKNAGTKARSASRCMPATPMTYGQRIRSD